MKRVAAVCPILSLFGLLLLCVDVATAQFTSSVQGTVVDSTGSVLPEVQLNLTNTDTGVAIDRRTNEEGIFRFPDLAPGRYRLRASKTGFQTVIQENILLESGRIQSVPITLSVGSITQEVTIAETATLVEMTNPKVSAVVTNEYVQNLPLGLRNIYNVVQLAPGVTGIGSTSDGFSNAVGVGGTANGMRQYSNAYYVDGSPVSDMAEGGSAKLTPNPDAVQEVRVSTNDYSAQWGKNAGILTQVVSKTGTNNFHGTMFWFHRNNKLTSRTVFQNTVPVFRRNDVGGSLGGPLIKNQTFFFGTFNELRASNSFSNTPTIETPEFVNFMRSRYPSRLSTSLLQNFPAQNAGFREGTVRTVGSLQPGCSGTNALGMPCDLPVFGTTTFSDANVRNGRQWNIRIDHNMNNGNDRIYANLFRTHVLTENKNVRPAFSTLGADAEGNPARSWYFSTNWTHIFSPTVINEASFTVTDQRNGTPCSNCQVPTISVTGIAGFGNGWSPGIFVIRDLNWQDILSITKGKHLLKFGFSYLVNQEPLYFTAPLERPGFTFNNIFEFAADDPFRETAINFNPETGSTQINNERDFQMPYWGFFVQDDWKIRPNLTFNLGLRWEFNTNPYDRADLLSNTRFVTGDDLRSRVAGMRMIHVDGLYENVPRRNLAPRVGIAWDPTGNGKISLRTGAGIFYDTFLTKSTFDRMQLNPPNLAAGTAQRGEAIAPLFAIGTSTKRPFGIPLPGVQKGLNAAGGPIGLRGTIAGSPGESQLPYAANWFAGVQLALTSKWMVELDYMGSRGVGLWSVIDRNRCAGCGATRIHPDFRIYEYHDNSGDSIYHGGTLAVRRVFDHGIGFQAAYTYGKTLDLMSGGAGFNQNWAEVYDAYDLRNQRGPSSGDYRHRLAFSYVWQLPTPKWNRVATGLLGGWQASSITVLQTGAPATVTHTGVDYNNDDLFLDLPNAPTKKFNDWSRSDYLTGTFLPSDFPAPPAGRGGNLGRNTFRGPGHAQVDFSLIKNNRLPWFTADGTQFQIRAEVFNLLNRVNLTNWSTNLAAPSTFGRATSQRDTRTFQLGLRMVF